MGIVGRFPRELMPEEGGPNLIDDPLLPEPCREGMPEVMEPEVVHLRPDAEDGPRLLKGAWFPSTEQRAMKGRHPRRYTLQDVSVQRRLLRCALEPGLRGRQDPA